MGQIRPCRPVFTYLAWKSHKASAGHFLIQPAQNTVPHCPEDQASSVLFTR